jgi:hypothetical protein
MSNSRFAACWKTDSEKIQKEEHEYFLDLSLEDLPIEVMEEMEQERDREYV